MLYDGSQEPAVLGRHGLHHRLILRGCVRMGIYCDEWLDEGQLQVHCGEHSVVALILRGCSRPKSSRRLQRGKFGANKCRRPAVPSNGLHGISHRSSWYPRLPLALYRLNLDTMQMLLHEQGLHPAR